jgi:hypothetical protein
LARTCKRGYYVGAYEYNYKHVSERYTSMIDISETYKSMIYIFWTPWGPLSRMMITYMQCGSR